MGSIVRRHSETMKVLADISIVPLGVGISLSKDEGSPRGQRPPD